MYAVWPCLRAAARAWPALPRLPPRLRVVGRPLRPAELMALLLEYGGPLFPLEARDAGGRTALMLCAARPGGARERHQR